MRKVTKFNANLWWASLLLENNEVIDKIVASPDFDPNKLDVEIKVNGTGVSIEDFEEFCHQTTDKLIKNKVEARGLLDQDRVITERARQILTGKFGNLLEKLQDLDSCLDNIDVFEEESSFWFGD